MIMESSSIEGRAFKSSSLVSEEAFKPVVNPQALSVRDDFLFVPAAGAGDDFSVDDFFDLQGLSEEEEEEEDEGEEKSSSSSSFSPYLDEGTSFSGAHCSVDFSAADGLAIPADDIQELELWSNLKYGALHDDNFACPNRVRFEPKVKPAMVEPTRFPPPPLTRPRSKRSRPIAGAWSSSSLFEPESSFSKISSSPEPGRVRVTKSGKAGVNKRLKRSAAGETTEDDGDSADEVAQVQPSKCTHCHVEKTPQWRAGPLGPKTLCNACGVRFNSGRLFPEYRPACSPTFSSEVHSNSHRKVVEMRKTKRKIAEPGNDVNRFFRF